MKKTMKKYAAIRKTTGSTAKTFATREAAREFKRMNGHKHLIQVIETGAIIR
jgi:hypothetical protein